MLITKTDILTYRPISKSVRDALINPYIKDAERLDVRPLLGELLYRAIDKTPSNVEYIKILDPFEYTYGDYIYNHDGLKQVIALFAWSRYVYFGSNVDTGFGFVNKSTQDSEPVTIAGKKAVYLKERQTALEYWADIERYLDRNATTYPLWRSGACNNGKISGIRISKITT